LQRILTAEFIHGTKVSNVESLKRQCFSLAYIDKKLFQAFSEQIFHTGFVQADPHPGNGKKVQNVFKVLKLHLNYMDTQGAVHICVCLCVFLNGGSCTVRGFINFTLLQISSGKEDEMGGM
jgi:hypothetical protein